MEETELRALIVATGRELLETGLVARTWGNVSGRLTQTSFLITPSGRDYLKTEPEDIVRVALPSQEWTGRCKPSSEKGIHAAAYECFPGVNFVIHTHQTCASALGLAGFTRLNITPAERERLGGIALAAYGLPGTKKLKNAVKAAMRSGAETVLMTGHGAVICGKSREDAMEKALLLEQVCHRSLAFGPPTPERVSREQADAVLSAVRRAYPHVGLVGSDPVTALANRRKPFHAQLDDMAQMLGGTVPWVEADGNGTAAVAALCRHGAVLVPGVGAAVCADNPEDTEALRLLLEKAAVCALHTEALGEKARLSPLDAALMHAVYRYKYAKQKG